MEDQKVKNVKVMYFAFKNGIVVVGGIEDKPIEVQEPFGIPGVKCVRAYNPMYAMITPEIVKDEKLNIEVEKINIQLTPNVLSNGYMDMPNPDENCVGWGVVNTEVQQEYIKKCKVIEDVYKHKQAEVS